MNSSWTFRGRSGIERFWRDVRSVPGRTNGREHHHEERYCLGLYLLALASHDLLSYPLRIEQGESPDFMLTWSSGETTGLEVTRATEPSLQRAMTAADREFARSEAEAAKSGGEPEPVATDLPQANGEEEEQRWCRLVAERIKEKLGKLSRFRRASRHDLLIYDDTPVLGKAREVFAAMRKRVRILEPRRGCAFAKISVIKSLDVAFDLGGDFRVLPYVDWSAPKLDDLESARDFAERAEYAAQTAAESAIKHHKQLRNPVYSVDARGRLVKETSDGRRFEVEVTPNGSEAIVRELRD